MKLFVCQAILFDGFPRRSHELIQVRKIFRGPVLQCLIASERNERFQVFRLFVSLLYKRTELMRQKLALRCIRQHIPSLLKRHPIMTINPAQVTRHHMAIQASPDFSLIRKACACGKASTAKQLAQHGKCAACALAAIRDAIMPGDFAKLQHMLGAVQQYPKSKWGWRNYFAAGSGQQHEAMQRLVAAGLATAGRAANEMTYFHATRMGCKVAGLDGAGIKRAMED